MTNQSSEEVLTYFSLLAESDFARTGGVATDTVVLGEGPLSDFGHSMEPQVTVQTLWSTASKTYALREAIEKKARCTVHHTVLGHWKCTSPSCPMA